MIILVLLKSESFQKRSAQKNPDRMKETCLNLCRLLHIFHTEDSLY